MDWLGYDLTCMLLHAVGVAAAVRYCKAKEVHDASLCGVSNLTDAESGLFLADRQCHW